MIARVLLAALVLAACTPGAGAPPAPLSTVVPAKRCIDTSPTASWMPIDARTVLVRTTGGAFRLTTARCPRLTDRTAVISRELLGGARLCSPRDVRLTVTAFDGSMPLPCLVEAITPLSPAQAAALEQAQR